MGDVNRNKLTSFLKLGISSLLATASLLTSCETEPPHSFYYTDADNQTDGMLILKGEANSRIRYRLNYCFVAKIPPKTRETILSRWFDGVDDSLEKLSLITLDSVIEVRNRTEDGRFILKDETDPSNRFAKIFIFSERYLAELADTMRKRGVPPYPISHEYVVNNTRQDFTLRCVSAERTWEYEIASGDSADIERRWLMEWHGTEGGHYEFVFADRTMTVWPAEIFGFSLRDVVRGHKAIPHRYFDFTVSREGGGVRRYEITDTLLRQISAEMAKVRKAQPGLFGR